MIGSRSIRAQKVPVVFQHDGRGFRNPYRGISQANDD